MMRVKFLCSLLLLLIPFSLLSSRNAAAEDVMKLVPSDVLGVAVVNNPVQTERKLGKLIEELQLPVPGLGAMIKQQIGDVKGIDLKGSVAIAAVPPSGVGGPTIVLFVPTTDYEELLGSVDCEETTDGISKVTMSGRPSLMASKSGYALLTDRSGEAVLKKTLASEKCLADEMTAVADRVAEADVYAVAGPTGIRMAQQQLLVGLASAKAQIEQQGEQMQTVAAGLGIYEALFNSLDKEITHVVVGGQLQEDGTVRIVVSTALSPDGTMAKLGDAPDVESAELLADLPSSDYLFAGGGQIPQEWIEPWAAMSIDMMKIYFPQSELSEEQAKELTDVSVKSLKGTQGFSMMMGVTKDGEPLYGNTVIVIKTENAKAYMKNYAEALEIMNGLMLENENAPFSMKANKIEVEGVETLHIEMDMTAMFSGRDVPGADQMFKMMFGNESGMSIYLAAKDDSTVVGTYVSKDRLADLLKRPADAQTLADDANVAKTLALLPAGIQGVALWSPSGTFRFVRQTAGAINPAAAAAIPEFPDTPPIGIGTALNSKRLDIDVIVPGELLKTTAAFVEQMKAAQGGPGPDQP